MHHQIVPLVFTIFHFFTRGLLHPFCDSVMTRYKLRETSTTSIHS
jgi:hypothetical protein